MTLHRLPSGYVFNDDDVSEVVPLQGLSDYSNMECMREMMSADDFKQWVADMSNGSRLRIHFRSRPKHEYTIYSGCPDFDALEALLKSGGPWK